MRPIALIISIVLASSAFIETKNVYAQNRSMKLNAGIITPKLQESKAFYSKVLGFGLSFENDFYILMHTPNHGAEISFLLPDHPTQRPLFQPSFSGSGVYLTIEVDDVDSEYNRIKSLRIPIAIELRDEPWGDRHFAIIDPNGIGIDIVSHTVPTN